VGSASSHQESHTPDGADGQREERETGWPGLGQGDLKSNAGQRDGLQMGLTRCRTQQTIPRPC